MFTLKSNFNETFFSKSNDADLISKRATFGRYKLNCDRFQDIQVHEEIRNQDQSAALQFDILEAQTLSDTNIHRQYLDINMNFYDLKIDNNNLDITHHESYQKYKEYLNRDKYEEMKK